MQALILLQLRHGCLVSIVHIYVFGKSPLAPALLQEAD